MPKTQVKDPHVKYRVGEWLPRDHRSLETWIDKLLDKIENDDRSLDQLHVVIQEFQALIENDLELYIGFQHMFDQIPQKPPYSKDPALRPQIHDYVTMLKAFDLIISHAPEFEENRSVICPISAILDWPMGTEAGLVLFLNGKVNAQFKKMFDVWAKFLSSPDSRAVLTTEEHGWFGPAASAAIPDFVKVFNCDPETPYHGFKSWDDFFTRTFRPGARAVQFPNDDSIINSACESSVYRVAQNVKKKDNFWLKGESYSLQHMLGNDDFTPKFVGGTVYQAYLSALNYHRWASPVNGTVVKTVLIPGTYYAESPTVGFENPKGPDPAGANRSQGYLTAVATRAVIFIEADNPKIGLMVFMGVGMVEVSTCEITVKEGQRLRKGDQLGMFHFGGSTYCLLFRPDTKVLFDPAFTTPDSTALLNVAIAVVE